MPMRDPPHPGEVIRELCIEPAGLTVTAAAAVLGVSRKALSELLNGHSGVSPEIAVRLSKAFDGSIESWLTQQMRCDLAQARKKATEIDVKRYEPA
jgi:antitoxin HigA-1